MYYRLVLILGLLTLYCYASPVEQNQQSQMMESNTIHEIQSHQVLNDLYHLKVLCALYGGCDDDDNQQISDYDYPKYKRLTSSLFHGIPKFGKRAFKSAFAGIPKFG